MRLLILLLVLSSCNGQNTTSKETNKKIKQDTIMKTFDIENFYGDNENGTSKTIELENGDKIVQFGNIENGFVEYYSEKGNVFQDYYEYYPSGKLKTLGKTFFNDFSTGIWKEYSEEGEVIKQENQDENYTYTWENIKEYLKEHKVVDIQKQVIGISRWSDNKATTWTLEFNGEYETIKGRYVITLDGKTGEELKVKLFKGKGALGEDATTAIYDTIYKKTN